MVQCIYFTSARLNKRTGKSFDMPNNSWHLPPKMKKERELRSLLLLIEARRWLKVFIVKTWSSWIPGPWVKSFEEKTLLQVCYIRWQLWELRNLLLLLEAMSLDYDKPGHEGARKLKWKDNCLKKRQSSFFIKVLTLDTNFVLHKSFNVRHKFCSS